MRIVELQSVTQQRLGCRPGQCTDLECASVQAAGHDVHESTQQRRDHVGRQRIHRNFAAGGGRVCEESQAQWMTVRDAENLPVQRPVHARPAQEFDTVRGWEVAQGDHPKQVRPSTIGPPRRFRRRASGEHGEG